jgi:hypothetical protein
MDSHLQTLIDEAEFCRRYQISRVTAWRRRRNGLQSYYKVGARIFYGTNHINEFLLSCERRADSRRWSKPVREVHIQTP